MQSGSQSIELFGFYIYPRTAHLSSVVSIATMQHYGNGDGIVYACKSFL